MKLYELIERLQEVLESFTEEDQPEIDVLLATQPNWPLAFTVSGVHNPEEDPVGCPDCCSISKEFRIAMCQADWHDEKSELPTIWIVEGQHPYGRSPYAPRAAWEG